MEFRVGIVADDSDQFIFGNIVVQGCPPNRELLNSPVRELFAVKANGGATVKELTIHDVRTEEKLCPFVLLRALTNILTAHREGARVKNTDLLCRSAFITGTVIRFAVLSLRGAPVKRTAQPCSSLMSGPFARILPTILRTSATPAFFVFM